MRKIALVSIVVLAIALGMMGARRAQAGARINPAAITVHNNADHSGYAFGAMGDARNRNSGTGSEAIGCLSWEIPGGGALGCSATDANGVSKACWASSNFLLFMIWHMSAITSDSYIYFSWDTSGNCNGIQIVNSSGYQPKKFFSAAP
jgi:hypothetical protein